MLRRDLILAGANLVALAGTAEAALPPPDPQANAKGVPGDQVSTDDYIQILQLYARYFHALDTGQGEVFADTFTEDGELTLGRGPGKADDDRTPMKGRAVLTKFASNGGNRHFTDNLVVTKTPEGARGSCYLMVYNARNVPATWLEIAIYDDHLVKTARGWKFTKRVVWRDDDDLSPFKPKPRPKAE